MSTTVFYISLGLVWNGMAPEMKSASKKRYLPFHWWTNHKFYVAVTPSGCFHRFRPCPGADRFRPCQAVAVEYIIVFSFSLALERKRVLTMFAASRLETCSSGFFCDDDDDDDKFAPQKKRGETTESLDVLSNALLVKKRGETTDRVARSMIECWGIGCGLCAEPSLWQW